MTEVTYYVADDGTQFEYEEDCMFYELKKNTKYFLQLDSGKEPTDNWDTTWYCYVSSKLGDPHTIDDLAKKYMEIEGSTIPHNCGYFCWNEGECEWENIDDKIDELEGQIMDLKNAKYKLEKMRED